MLRLTALDPRFFRYDIGIADEDHGRPLEDGEIQWGGFPIDVLTRVNNLSDADGIRFLCPGCFLKNGGMVGTHQIMACFAERGAPPHIGLNSEGQTTRWEVMGNDFLDLTLSPSIHVKRGCGWHGWVQHGEVRTA